MSKNNINDLLDSLVKIIVNPVTINLFYPYKVINKNPSTGTGIVIDSDDNNLYILTCAHVIENKAKITVMSRHNKERVNAIPLGICFDKDVAMLKVDKNDKKFKYLDKVKTIPINNNVTIAQGDIVKAIGYPLSEENPILTSGVFSGFKKNYYQVDTPVNPGNSGGPLVNENLQIVGIVSSKVPNDVAANIAYVIPLIHIDKIIKNLKTMNEHILYEPKLGMTFMNVDKNIYNTLKTDLDYGYYVKKVYISSPFSNSIKSGDLILEIDENKIDRYGFISDNNQSENYKLHITDYYSRKMPDENVKIKYFNNETTQEVTINITNTNIFNIRSLNYPYEKIDYEIFSGMILTELTIDHILNSNNNVTDQNDYLITKYLQHDYRDEKILFIASILQGSYVSELDIFGNGEIITHIDDIELATKNSGESILDTARNIINTNESGYIKFTSITNKFVVINIIDALSMEPELSEHHKYDITVLNKSLGTKYAKNNTDLLTNTSSSFNHTYHNIPEVYTSKLDGGSYKKKRYKLLK